MSSVQQGVAQASSIHAPSDYDPSSPGTHSRETTPCTDSRDDRSPEPLFCDCQNQLAHWDWNSVPHKDLRDACKRSMGIPLEPTSGNDVNKADENVDSLTESDSEWDPQWEHGKIDRFRPS